MTRWIAGGVMLLGITSAPMPANSQSSMPFPRHRLTYNAMLVGRYNGLGLRLAAELRYRYRLHRSGEPLKQDAHLGLSFDPTVNPSLTRIGPELVIKPLALVTIKAGYFYNIWHGAVGNITSYEYVEDDYFTEDWDFDADGREVYPTTGHEVLLTMNLLLPIGPIVISNHTEGNYANQALRSGDQLYYAPRYDILAADRGWILSNDADLVFVTQFGLVAGARVSLVHAFYKGKHFEEGSGDAASTPVLTLGPLLAYTFFDRPLSGLSKPSLFLIVGWWLKHRYRTGEAVEQGVPWVMLGVSFEGDIWSTE